MIFLGDLLHCFNGTQYVNIHTFSDGNSKEIFDGIIKCVPDAYKGYYVKSCVLNIFDNRQYLSIMVW